jgi:hypothetical protein
MLKDFHGLIDRVLTSSIVDCSASILFMSIKLDLFIYKDYCAYYSRIGATCCDVKSQINPDIEVSLRNDRLLSA